MCNIAMRFASQAYTPILCYKRIAELSIWMNTMRWCFSDLRSNSIHPQTSLLFHRARKGVHYRKLTMKSKSDLLLVLTVESVVIGVVLGFIIRPFNPRLIAVFTNYSAIITHWSLSKNSQALLAVKVFSVVFMQILLENNRLATLLFQQNRCYSMI